MRASRPVDTIGVAQTVAADANFNEWEDEDDAEAARIKFAGMFAPLLVIKGHHYDLWSIPERTPAMPQEPKRPVSELKPAELRTIVGDIQKLLWLDEYATTSSAARAAHPLLECRQGVARSTSLEAIATVLEDHGLKPIDPPTVIGFDTVDKFSRRSEDDADPQSDYGDSDTIPRTGRRTPEPTS